MKRILAPLALVVPILAIGGPVAAQPGAAAPTAAPPAPTIDLVAPFRALAKAAAKEAESCPAISPKPAGGNEQSCASAIKAGDEVSLCPAYDTKNPLSLRSNRCVNEKMNKYVRDAAGNPVDYTLFGEDDCRTGAIRPLSSITKVIVHNGGYTPEGNKDTWQCRPAASHYSIARDGRIVQHAGEERVVWHAGAVNEEAIGIELNVAKIGYSCNDIPKPVNRERVMAACAPTEAQYKSLRNLLFAIAGRTSVPFDESHVMGHCEVVGAGGHGDPRAFDWSQVGLSNAKKDEFVRDRRAQRKPTACEWYGMYSGH